MPFGIGAPELIIVLVIILLVFGARRVPELGRSLGSGMREFKDSVSGKDDDSEKKPKKTDATADKPAADADAGPAALNAPKDDAQAERVDDAEVVTDSR